MALSRLLDELGRDYEARSGRRVNIVSVGGVDAARRVGDGETFDVVVLARDAIDALAAAGRIDPASRVDLAGSAIALAVARGRPRPDVSSEAALRDALLATSSIGYSTGPSGNPLLGLLERWGIADAVVARLVKAPPGTPVGSLVASGAAALGIQQKSELIHVPGLDVLDALPPGVALVTVFCGAVCTASGQARPARELLAFLASPAADEAKLRLGLEPAGAGRSPSKVVVSSAG